MRTVKEISIITGISVRTLHYYDEIGLLKPTEVSEAGYRLYDDRALEVLREILFFREFDMPLREIKELMGNPVLDRNKILHSQRKMLELKKERLDRLIGSIDCILKGENKMDFNVFSKAEIEDLYQTMVQNMSEEMQGAVLKEFGAMEDFHDHYIGQATSEQAQKNYEKIVEWYGSKEDALNAAKHPMNLEVLHSYQNRIDSIMKKIAADIPLGVQSFEVKSHIDEYAFVLKQLYQMKDVKQALLDLAQAYRDNREMTKSIDQNYGPGIALFFADAVMAYYR